MAQYKVCQRCGAHLDPGEPCECAMISEEKRGFITRLKLLLVVSDVDLFDLKLIDNDTVEATYFGGGTRKINIAADSKVAIIKDIVNHII